MSHKMTLDPTVADAFHAWYADGLARDISYRGVPIMKWIGDLWNYQEIIVQLRPSLIIEFGTACGGSALWFADLMAHVNPSGWVYSFDIYLSNVSPSAMHHPQVKCERHNTANLALRERLADLRRMYPGAVFAILDSDHRRAHVLAEMTLLRPILTAGDYLVVEDSNLHGHPIWPGYPEGPFEAIADYEQAYPDDYSHDTCRERRFGFTFAVNGYLVRR